MKCMTLKQKTTAKVAAAFLAATLTVSSLSAMPVFAAPTTEDAAEVTATGVTMYTSYPGQAVTAGDSVSFSLSFDSLDGEGHYVFLETASIPENWSGYFKGNSTEVSKAYVSRDGSSSLVTYVLSIPSDAEDGIYNVELLATTEDGDTSTVTLVLDVTAEEFGESNFSTEYPAQEGTSGTSFSFETTLKNNRASDQSYALSAQAPDGWTVTFTPSSESTYVASVTLESGSTETITIAVTPPSTVEKGDYTIPITAVSATDTLSLELSVSILGSYSVNLTTSDGRASFDAYENEASTVTLVITNTGNVDLESLNLSSSVPTDWDVTFSESTIDTLEAGASKEITMYVTPCENAITGDYEVDITIKNSVTSDTVQFRVSVKTSTTWGVAAIGIVLALILILVLIFKRYGRR